MIQVRGKHRTDRDLCDDIMRVGALCRASSAMLIINDRIDLALATGANGVHLGQDDVPPSIARRLLGDEAVIGLSTHNPAQFQQAQDEPVDYVAVGPVFCTTTKRNPDPIVGLKMFSRMAGGSRIPVVAIGGVNLSRARRLWSAGASSVAVVSDVLQHPDPSARVRQYLEAAEEI